MIGIEEFFNNGKNIVGMNGNRSFLSCCSHKYVRFYKKIIQRIKKSSKRTKIYFNTLIPVNNTFPDRAHFNKDEHIAAVNIGLKRLCEAEKITLIDIHPHYEGEDMKLDKSMTYDGLHLNAEGYKKWAFILQPYLKN